MDGAVAREGWRGDGVCGLGGAPGMDWGHYSLGGIDGERNRPAREGSTKEIEDGPGWPRARGLGRATNFILASNFFVASFVCILCILCLILVLLIVDGQQEKEVDSYSSSIFACLNVYFGCEF
jgi:hypothetical protein